MLWNGMVLYAQLPPALQPDSWIPDTAKSDEFNDTILDASKWWKIDPCNYTDSIYHGYNWGSADHFRPENVSLSNGNLVLTADYNPDSLNDLVPCVHRNRFYRFYSGGIQSIQTREPIIGNIGNYSFGFYEMRAKIPGYYDANNQPVGTGFLPAFWIYYQNTVKGCIKKHDEVDILEPNSVTNIDGRTNHVTWHDENYRCSADAVGSMAFTYANPLFEAYHKYAVALFSDKITFYFDDRQIFSDDTITSPGIVHSLNMSPYLAVVMSLAIEKDPYPPADAPFPQFMYIDYFRYYQLKPDHNALFQNYPNPLTNATEIAYYVSNSANTFIKIYDLAGREIKSVYLADKGKSIIRLDCSDLKSGVYFYRLSVDNVVVGVKKMIVMK